MENCVKSCGLHNRVSEYMTPDSSFIDYFIDYVGEYAVMTSLASAERMAIQAAFGREVAIAVSAVHHVGSMTLAEYTKCTDITPVYVADIVIGDDALHDNDETLAFLVESHRNVIELLNSGKL